MPVFSWKNMDTDILELHMLKRLTNTRLISEVRSRPLLWDKRNPEPRSRYVMDSLWEEVSTIVGKERELCKKRWKNLLDRFRRVYQTTILPLTPNSSSVDVEEALDSVKWIHFKQLLFLKDVIAPVGEFPGNNRLMVSAEHLVNVLVKVENEEMEMQQKLHEALLNSPHLGSNEESILPDLETSSEASVSIAPSYAASPTTSHNSPLHANRIRKGVKRMMPHLEEEHLVAEREGNSRDPRMTADPTSCFGDYLVSVLREVPPHLRRRCEFQLLQVANAFADNVIPQIVLPPSDSSCGSSNFATPAIVYDNSIHSTNSSQ